MDYMCAVLRLRPIERACVVFKEVPCFHVVQSVLVHNPAFCPSSWCYHLCIHFRVQASSVLVIVLKLLAR